MAASIVLAGCVLPEGKLVAAAIGDAGPEPARPRGAGRLDAAVAEHDSERSGAGGASGNAHEAGRGGAGGAGGNASRSDAEDAGSSDAPRGNGETCTTGSDCASGNCRMSRDGLRCHGLIPVDRACSGMYDCDGYTCIPTTADGKNGVCVDSSRCSSQNQCARDYWAAT
ncbi:MAG: hypothetical protein ABW321_22740, partial [Polyangiales bacterium]